MIRHWRRMLAVLVSHGKFAQKTGLDLTKANNQCSHIKGKASHKIVSDGRLFCYIPMNRFANGLPPQRGTYSVT
jgi:hypothetical protein